MHAGTPNRQGKEVRRRLVMFLAKDTQREKENLKTFGIDNYLAGGGNSIASGIIFFTGGVVLR